VPEGSEPVVAEGGGSSSLDTGMAVNPQTPPTHEIVRASAPTPDLRALDDIFASMDRDDEDGLLDEELLVVLL
jgi:hypothetical protein